MLGLKMPWTKRREREAAIAARQAEIAHQLEQRRVLARERAAWILAARVASRGGSGRP